MLDCLLLAAVGLFPFRFMPFLTGDAILSNQAFRHKLGLKYLKLYCYGNTAKLL